MTIIECPGCLCQVSNKAEKCPHCGIDIDIRGREVRKMVDAILEFIFGVAILYFYFQFIIKPFFI